MGKKSDLVLEAVVEFTPALLESGAMEIPIKILNAVYHHKLKEPSEATERRRERVQQTRSLCFLNDHRQMDIKLGDDIIVEGEYNSQADDYDPIRIHRRQGMRILATYHLGKTKPDAASII
ncbi:hypothetical protein FJZ17_01535 [Candidatus Pacearchaeota archaeon]|nr:hypothetical protein [Candidatus Pacearchaeota archaeon]